MQHRAPTPPPPKGPPPKRTPINTTAPRTPPKGPISACNTPPGTPVFYLNEVTPPGTPVITEDTRTQATEDSFTITITDTENSDFDSDEEPTKVDLNGAPSPVSTPPGTPQGAHLGYPGAFGFCLLQVRPPAGVRVSTGRVAVNQQLQEL